MTKIAETISKVKNNQLTIGSWMQLPSPDVAEIMGKSGYDWVAIDMEHGSFSPETVTNVIRSIELGDTAAAVRVAQVSPKDIKDALDSGARGLIYPMIDSAELLKQAIEWSEYPPSGTRGVGPDRTTEKARGRSSRRKREAARLRPDARWRCRQGLALALPASRECSLSRHIRPRCRGGHRGSSRSRRGHRMAR